MYDCQTVCQWVYGSQIDIKLLKNVERLFNHLELAGLDDTSGFIS